MKTAGDACGIYAESLKEPDETLEPLLMDRGYILQKRQGYRFSIDAILLASLVTKRHKVKKGDKEARYMDLGTGCGIVPILLAMWSNALTGVGVEIQESLAAMAVRNFRIHGLTERFQVLCSDLKDLPGRFSRGALDWITMNPPYRQLHTGRVNPDPQKAMARHELTASLKDICSVIGYLLREKGRAFMIYPAGRMNGLVTELKHVGLEPEYVRPVYPKPGERARWVLMEAVCKGAGELVLDEPLFLEDGKGAYSDEINRMFRWEFGRCSKEA